MWPYSLPTLFMRLVSKLSLAASSAAVLLSPLSAFAVFTDGPVVPAGTTTSVTGAISTYLYPTVMATLFQSQMIEIAIVLAVLGLVVWAVRALWGRIFHPHR